MLGYRCENASILGAALLATLVTAGAAFAGESPAPKSSSDARALRVCASASELPYSSKTGDGFENKIAKVLAEQMNRPIDFVWSDRASIYLVPELLDKKKCDVVMGADTGDDRVLTSKSYYRTGYVFILRKDSRLAIKGWDSPDVQNARNVGFTPGSPAQVMMEKIGIYRDNFAYMNSLSNFQDKRNRFTRVPPERMVNEVADGTADLAVNFAPEVARYVAAHDNLTMVMIPDDNVHADGVKVPHQFNQSIAVRKDDAALQAEINDALEKSKGKIEAILKQEGIPLLPVAPAEKGKPSSTN